MVGAAQSVWESLDKLQKDDPAKYKVVWHELSEWSM